MKSAIGHTMWRRLCAFAVIFLAVPTGGFFRPAAHAQSSSQVVEDFESYSEGQVPAAWKYVNRQEEALPIRRQMDEREKFYVAEEDGNKFARAYTKGEALRVTQRNGKEFNWNLDRRAYLQWKWRANRLPQGASEKDENDTGGAVYVTFGTDWLGRPKSIKYTYSSTLPVGTAVDFGPLKALVVASGAEGMGAWKTETRNVAQDYRNFFGDEPPAEPLSITLWSDSDSVSDGVAEVDFDDIRLLTRP